MRTEERNAGNETLPWSFFVDKDGKEVPQGTVGAIEARRVKQLLVFALLPQDLLNFEAELKKAEDAGELPDPSKAVTPVVLSFRSTSYKAGKEVATFFTQCSDVRVPMHKYQVKLSCKLETKDQDSFYVWTVDRSKPKAVDKAVLGTVENWAKLVNSKAVNDLAVDAEGDEDTYAAAQAVAAAAPEAQDNRAEKAEVC